MLCELNLSLCGQMLLFYQIHWTYNPFGVSAYVAAHCVEEHRFGLFLQSFSSRCCLLSFPDSLSLVQPAAASLTS